MNNGSNLRKAAVLLRSLDADTAAVMLAQLSAEEAASIRGAIRALGSIDPEEQADVLAEFRRVRPAATKSGGVELAFSSSLLDSTRSAADEADSADGDIKRFEFLANAPTKALVPYLAREHAQTIAVVLSHLAPGRAADVLAELPEKLQADTIERLSVLGETDPQSVTALEHELAAWIAKRAGGRAAGARRRETVANILAAADAKTRSGILSNLKTHNVALAEQIAPLQQFRPTNTDRPRKTERRPERALVHQATGIERLVHSVPQSLTPSPPPLPRIDFDHLIHLNDRALATVLREVNANVLALALAGSRDELVNRICEQMPKRTAKTFRRELRRLGPTRLSDVAAAQGVVAEAATRLLAHRRRTVLAAHC